MTPMVDMPRKVVPPPLELVKGRIEELLPPDAKGEIDAGDATVIDVREAERFDKGHLAGAINLSSGESARAAHTDDYADSIAEAAGGKDKRVILVCGQGNRSARTADALKNEHGFEQVASVIGGIKLWDDLGYPVEGEVAVEADDVELEGSMEGDTT
jgi:rhodanese-related sulfurtransferase